MLSSSKLANELGNIGLQSTEAGARAAWAAGFAAYFEDAQSNAVPVVAAGLPVAQAAMEAALTGLSLDGPGALQAGLLAFWGALVTPTCWPTATAVTPPPALAGAAAALQVVFLANTSGALPAAMALAAVASALHTVNQGGLVAWPDPVGAQLVT